MLQRVNASMLRLAVVVFLLGFAACSEGLDDENTSPENEPVQELPKDDLTKVSDEDVLEQIVLESVILLTGGYLSDEDVQSAAAEIFSHPQTIDTMNKLLRSAELENIDRRSLIYISGLSGREEFVQPLFEIATSTRLDPEIVDEIIYERRELERMAAISTLGRLGDVEKLEALLEVAEPHNQRVVWLQLHKLDREQWPMRKLAVEPGQTFLSDPKYQEMFNGLTEDFDMDGITVLDDEGSECEELEEWWPEDELWLAIMECEGEECDELWALAIECGHPCAYGCDSNEAQELTSFESSQESIVIGHHITVANATSEDESSSLGSPSCPKFRPWYDASITELGRLDAVDVFEALSANLPTLWAAVLTALITHVDVSTEWCDDELIEYYKDKYSFDDSWDKQMGKNRPCDLNTALGRTLNAIHLLHTASPREPLPWLSTPEDLLAEAGRYTGQHIPKLIATCKDDSVYMSTKAKIRAKKRHVTIHPPGFYEQYTVERASTLVHEARHTQRCRHNGNDGKNKCVSRSQSCDESYFDGCKKRVKSPPGKPPGASGYEARWLQQYLKYAEGEKVVTDESMATALWVTNYVLNQRFDVDPGFNVDEDGVSYVCVNKDRESNRLRCTRGAEN